MAVNLAPIGNGFQFFSETGLPLNAGTIATYAAGTTTPQATYTDSTGGTPNANPIVLDTDGRPPQEIWFTAGQAYKFVLSDSLGNILGTYDNLAGINDISAANTTSEWITGPSASYVSGTQFTTSGNTTPYFQVGRRIQVNQTGGIYYGSVTASSFSTITTVTVQMDSTPLNTGLTTVNYALLGSTNPSVPHRTGDIVFWPGSVIPPQTALCNGQSLNIAEFPALYAIIGTTFGQNGGAGTYQLPDLRGRSPIGVGTGIGLANTYTLAEKYGEETHVLAVGELATHSHDTSVTVNDAGHAHVEQYNSSGTNSNQSIASQDSTAPSAPSADAFSTPTKPSTTGITLTVTNPTTGSSAGHNTVHPVLAGNWIINL